MLEISPVLAGTYSQPNYVPASLNVNSGNSAGAASASDAVDPRRYSQFDRTASQTGNADFSFGDLLDLLNPLEHIPVVSSIYRAVTGDTINPVSRVAGDILFAGPLGVASAIASGVGAVADTMMEAKTGKDVAGTVYASLFGEDAPDSPTNPVLIAAADKALPATAQAPTPTASTDAKPLTQRAEGIPLNRNKLPYGGAMAPIRAMPTRTVHDENLAMAVTSATGFHVGNMVYANNMKNGMRALPAAAPVAKPAAANSLANASDAGTLPSTPVPTAMTASIQPAAITPPVPESLGDDALILKALGMYQNAASLPAGGSDALNPTN